MGCSDAGTGQTVDACWWQRRRWWYPRRNWEVVEETGWAFGTCEKRGKCVKQYRDELASGPLLRLMMGMGRGPVMTTYY